MRSTPAGSIRAAALLKNLFWIVPLVVCFILAPSPAERQQDLATQIGLKAGWLLAVFAVDLVPLALYIVYCAAKKRRPSIVLSLSIVSSTALLVIATQRVSTARIESMLNAEATRAPAVQGELDTGLFPVKSVDSPDWNWIAKGLTGEFWVDFIGMKRDRGEVQILVKQRFNEPRPTPQGMASGAVTLFQINCAQKEFASRWERTYDAKGDFKGLSVQSAADKRSVPPGSIIEDVMWRACNNKPAG